MVTKGAGAAEGAGPLRTLSENWTRTADRRRHLARRGSPIDPAVGASAELAVRPSGFYPACPALPPGQGCARLWFSDWLNSDSCHNLCDSTLTRATIYVTQL